MSTLGNIIWFIIGGWWNFLIYGFLGILCCITIIGIPIGKALFQYAKLMVFPFGKVIIKETDLKGKENVAAIRRVGGVIANIIWLPVGIVMFISNIVLAVGSAITIIGIPVAIVLVRSAKFLIWPVGAKVITKAQADTLQMERTMMKVAGNAMAANQMMAFGQPVFQQPIQQGQALENGQQSVYGQAAVPVQPMSVPVQAMPVQTASAETQFGQIRIKSKEKAEELRIKLEQNQALSKIYPYMEYIAIGICVLLSLLPVAILFIFA